MNIVISKIGFDCRDADFSSIHAWEGVAAVMPALFHVGVVYPSNKTFMHDLNDFVKISPKYLVDFLLVSSSGYPIAWKLGGEISFPNKDISWVLNIEPATQSVYLKTVNEFIIKNFQEIESPFFINFQIYFDEIFRKKIELIVPDFDLINKELITYLAGHPEHLHRLDWRKFEELLDVLFKRMGYESSLGPGRNDMGVDLRLIKREDIGKLLVLVQAKKYAPKYRISLQPVQALFGAVNDENASKGILVSTSEFEPVAKRFAENKEYRIELAGPDSIRKWLQSY